MKEYLVIFAQLLCVGWLLRTMAKARGNPDDEQLGWFDIREGGKPPKASGKPKPPSSAGGAGPAPKPQQGKAPHA